MNLLKDNVYKLYFKYLFPTMCAALSTSIYILFDTIFIGQGVGSLGLTALNIALPIYSIYFGTGLLIGIGGSTLMSIEKDVYKRQALSRRFQTIEVKETSIEETIKIINGLKSNYESYHNVKYTNNAIKIAVELSSKYINDRFLPDKAIDIIDEAGAYASMNRRCV